MNSGPDDQGPGHRGRQGRPDPGHRPARVPARLAGRSAPRPRPASLRGQELEAKIIELDRNRNNVVLSRRAFLEESQSEGRKKFLESLQKGERRKGTVSSIVNFGAFVDLGGVDGLVHVSELSWKHVDHPSEVVAVGQEVEVEVLDVDLERERVSLSLKATQEDPWKEFERTSTAGVGHQRTGHEARAVRRVRAGGPRHRGPRPYLRALPRARGHARVGAVGGRRGPGQGDRRRRARADACRSRCAR